ncbi:MAG: hypothetical protein V2J20_04640, partial [Wenzhouxiangella sp.]|nr:hypothetical protein [Wenzhouxiangella sp.]
TIFCCTLLIGCGQIDKTMMHWEQSEAVAAELEEITGIGPSTSANWENDKFREFVVEFSRVPAGFTKDDIITQVRASFANHFDTSPQHLKVIFADSGEPAGI